MCTGVHTKPFGGTNIILAGDFAQLPPVDTNGHALYSRFVAHTLASCKTLRQQKEAIDKAMWHQVTSVVLLRKNMCQRQQDAKLRTALENMRYASCTADDILYLKSRIAGKVKTNQIYLIVLGDMYP